MSLLSKAIAMEGKKYAHKKLVPGDVFELVEAFLRGEINRTQATFAAFGKINHSGFDSIFKRTIESGIKVGRYEIKVNQDVKIPNEI